MSLNSSALTELAMQKPGAYSNMPFGPDTLCVRVGARIFFSVYLPKDWVSFKCEPQLGLCWRAAYPLHVRRGYHCPPVQQPHNNTVILDGTVSDEILVNMLDHSYERALQSMTRLQRQQALCKSGAQENSTII